MPQLVDVAAVLAAGLVPGTDGYDPATLAAAIETRGWRWSVEPVAGSPPTRRRFRALVVASSHRSSAGAGLGPIPAARGRGATEAAALAQALAQLLVMFDRGEREAAPR